jgi:hypothetical protein
MHTAETMSKDIEEWVNVAEDKDEELSDKDISLEKELKLEIAQRTGLKLLAQFVQNMQNPLYSSADRAYYKSEHEKLQLILNKMPGGAGGGAGGTAARAHAVERVVGESDQERADFDAAVEASLQTSKKETLKRKSEAGLSPDIGSRVQLVHGKNETASLSFHIPLLGRSGTVIEMDAFTHQVRVLLDRPPKASAGLSVPKVQTALWIATENLRLLQDPAPASDPASRGSAEPGLVSPQDFRPGAWVVRGPDWSWQDQDGGAGNTGILGEHINKTGWVQVTWQNGNVNHYRVAGPYELQYATDEQQELAQELAQAIAMSLKPE